MSMCRATHSSTLAWKIPWRSLVGCSPWGCEELDMTERLHFHFLEMEMATHSSVLAWRIPGTGEPGGLPSRVTQSRTLLKRLSSSSSRVFSCAVGRGCLLWPVCSLGKTLLAFALLHSVLQGQICLLLQVFLTSYFCTPVPYNEKDIIFEC